MICEYLDPVANATRLIGYSRVAEFQIHYWSISSCCGPFHAHPSALGPRTVLNSHLLLLPLLDKYRISIISHSPLVQRGGELA